MLSALLCLMSKKLSNASCPSSSGSSPYPLSFEAFDDVVHCELCNILCSELCFHNDFRLSVQTSPIQPWSQSVMVFHLELNLPEPHISFPLSKCFRRCGHRIVALAHPLCGQFHLTSPRISAHLAEYFCPDHSPRISAPLPV